MRCKGIDKVGEDDKVELRTATERKDRDDLTKKHKGNGNLQRRD